IAVLFANAARKRAGDEDDYDDQLSDDPFEDSGLDDSTDLSDTCDDTDDTDDTDGDGEHTEAGPRSPVDDGGDVCTPEPGNSEPGDSDPDAGPPGPGPGPDPGPGAGPGPLDGDPAGRAPGSGPDTGPGSGDESNAAPTSGTGNSNPQTGQAGAGTMTGSTETENDTAAARTVGTVGVAGFAAGELRVQVSTLMHLDDLPAELAGWGPIHAQLARRLAKRQIGGEWRFAICDEQGQLLHAGITRRRPAGWPRHPAPDPAPGPVHGRGFTPGLPSQPLAGDNRDGSDPAGTARVGVTPARTPAAGQEDSDRPGGALHARPASVRRRGIVEL
ncbi:hypothetical protein IMZ11_42320, partial [Microtetraspora sp. AC03309]|nr:hypothetical protein [Microtetraspora sp. AC03309]